MWNGEGEILALSVRQGLAVCLDESGTTFVENCHDLERGLPNRQLEALFKIPPPNVIPGPVHNDPTPSLLRKIPIQDIKREVLP